MLDNIKHKGKEQTEAIFIDCGQDKFDMQVNGKTNYSYHLEGNLLYKSIDESEVKLSELISDPAFLAINIDNETMLSRKQVQDLNNCLLDVSQSINVRKALQYKLVNILSIRGYSSMAEQSLCMRKAKGSSPFTSILK